MALQFPKNDILFTECIEALGTQATILGKEESNKIWKRFKSLVPIAPWGKIDWVRIDKKIEIGYEPELIIVGMKQLKNHFDKSIYILWNDASLPIVKADLLRIVTFFDDVACVAPDIWLLSTSLNYIVEIFHDGEITIGLLPKDSFTIRIQVRNYDLKFIRKSSII